MRTKCKEDSARRNARIQTKHFNHERMINTDTYIMEILYAAGLHLFLPLKRT